MTGKTFKDYLKEDGVDQDKHDALNNIEMTLGALEKEVLELHRLDGDRDSSGVGDLTDQLTTMRKLVSGFKEVIGRSTNIVPMDDKPADDKLSNMMGGNPLDSFPSIRGESVNEDDFRDGHDLGLLKQVSAQIAQDVANNDYTAIDDLLKNVSEAEMRGFLSEVEETMNKPYGTIYKQGVSRNLAVLKKNAGIT